MSSISMGLFVTGRNIEVGNNSVINRMCYLDGRGGISIGSNVSISPSVYIISLTHDYNDPNFMAVGKKVIIEDSVWIGARATILPGVRIGKGAVIGTGSVVTKDVSPFSVVVGVPAKKIGERKNNINYTLKYFPLFDTDEIL